MDKDLFVDPGHVAKYMVGRPKVPKEFANLVVKLIKENSSGVTYDGRISLGASKVTNPLYAKYSKS